MRASDVKKRLVTGLRRVGATILAATTAAMTVASGGAITAFANGGTGSSGEGGGTGMHVYGYTYWYDRMDDGKNPTQGWNQDSRNWWQNYIEGQLGQKMTSNYLQYFNEAAYEALNDAKTRSETSRARIVGVSSTYGQGSTGIVRAYKGSMSGWAQTVGARAGTVDELPNNVGWSTEYKNADGATGGNWRQWLYQYGYDKAAPNGATLTVVVWAVAEGEPLNKGHLTLQKTSANPDYTNGNSAYDMKGAVYGIYKDAACTNLVQQYEISSSNGTGGTVDLEPGDYYVKEISGAKGYDKNDAVKKVTITPGNTSNVVLDGSTAETAMNDPVDVLVQKAMEGFDTAGEAEGDVPDLSGIRFQIDYYANLYDSADAAKKSGNPKASAVFATDAQGRLKFDEAQPVSGSWPYKTANGKNAIPLGSVVITEVSAKAGVSVAAGYGFLQLVDSGDHKNAAVAKKVQLGDGASSIKTTVDAIGGAFADKPWMGGLTVVKADNDMDTSEAQGDGVLTGVSYDIINRSKNVVKVDGKKYKPGEVVKTIRTSWNDDTKRYEATTGSKVLPFGKYEVKETGTPDSYKNANFDDTFNITTDGQMVSYDAKSGKYAWNRNAVKRGGVSITKFDRQSHQSKSEGEAHLDGATFEIVNESINKDGGKVVVDGKTYNHGDVVKTISTVWDNDAKAYVAKTAADALPYGTYTVREVGTGKGYLYDKTSKAWTKTFSIRRDGQMVKFDSYDKSVSNQVIREDWNFKKKADDSAERMNNVAFLVTSQTTGEKHVIVTDENGTWGSSWNAHTQNTNANDPDSPITNGAIKADADGNYYVADSSKLDAEAGTWFTGYKPDETTWAANGKSYKISGSDYDVPVDDALRAFPYDTYTVQELRSDANEGYGLVNVTVTLHKYGDADGEGLDIDYGTLDDQPIAIGTELLFGADHVAPAAKDTELTDTVTYSGLSKDKEYEMYGELHKVSADGKDEGVVATSSEKFTPKQNSGKTKVTFKLDTSDLGGSKLVAYEYAKSEGQIVAKHEDIEDDDQSVTIPKIGTTLSGDIDHEANASTQTIKLTDTVKYEGLALGKNYTLTGTLMDKATGQPVTDADGNAITAQTTFSPAKASGKQDVVFTFSGVDMAGKTVVAFESLNVGDVEYATHADINDTDQTVTFPKVQTTAQTSSKTKEVLADKDQKVVDTVKMSNLIAGKKYTLTGTLHIKNADGTDGGELKDADGKVVTATKEFTATGKDDESQDLEFTVDASLLGGKTLVAFETLSRDKVTVGLHADITDDDQTVVVPKIGTTMTDANGSHEVSVTAKSDDKKSDDIDAETETKSDDKTESAEDTAKSTDAKVDEKAVTPEAAADKADATADAKTESDAKSDESGEEAKETVKSSVVDGTKVTLTDTVAYDNLIVGQKYTVNGTLHIRKVDDKGNITDGGVLKDSDGKEVTASAEFTPEKTSGTVDVTFTFDAGDLSGQSVVAFEDVKNGDVTVATHADITDEDQTVHFVEIGTKAVDTTTTTKTIGDAEKVSITDTVEYKNLIPGNTYTVNGTLHIQKKDDKGNITDGGVLKDANGNEVTATASFVPDKANGSTEVKFEFTTKTDVLDGQTLVAFEDMKNGDVLVATHSDITDENQAVHGLKIGTTLTSDDGKTKEIGQNKSTKLVDVVKFENLNVGETYTIKGKLVDGSGNAIKDADGKEVTAEGTFTPKESVGTANVNFTVDTSAMTNGTKLVAYEYVYAANGTLVGKHEDATDENQTVTMKVETPPEKPETPGNHVDLQTGIKAYGLLFALGLVAAAVIGGTYAYRKRHGTKA